jgi:hypothetical protein
MSEKKLDPKFYFYLYDGRVLKNKKDLIAALKNMNDGVFFHHVNPSTNDFSNWLNGVFKEKALASKLAKLKSKEEVLACLTGKKIKKKIKLTAKAVNPVQAKPQLNVKINLKKKILKVLHVHKHKRATIHKISKKQKKIEPKKVIISRTSIINKKQKVNRKNPHAHINNVLQKKKHLKHRIIHTKTKKVIQKKHSKHPQMRNLQRFIICLITAKNNTLNQKK